jgi:nucleoside phosphorylase/tetratricopeptide (TPR) repeat protein
VTPVARVFLSYASADKPAIRRFAAALRVAGHEPWFDEEQILVGESIPSAVERGLRDADFVVICMSKVAAERGWVEADRDATLMQQFSEQRERILPVRLEDVAPPHLIAPIAYVDLFPDDAFLHGIARLTRSIDAYEARRGRETERSRGASELPSNRNIGSSDVAAPLTTCPPQTATAHRRAPVPVRVQELGSVTADLVVLTVLPEEYAAVLSCLRDPGPVRGNAAMPNSYAWRVGMIDTSHFDAAFRVVVGMGTPTTTFGALAASQAIALFDPRYIAFVGVAGGFDRDGQRHGDVVVSSVVTAYEYGKVDTGGFAPRANFTYRCNEALVRATDAATATGAQWWNDADNPGGPPRARTGMIASGDKVVDDPDDAFFTAVGAMWPKLLAVEMEGAGVAAAVHEVQGQRAVGFMLVRGISDMPHSKPPGAPPSTQERDGWKVAASRNAARFLAHLVATAWPHPPRGDTNAASTPAAAGSAPPTQALAHSPVLGTHTFIGRERELAEIEALLTCETDVQLRVALNGLPGIGKTELARQVVARLAQGKKFPGGIFWFDAENADLQQQWAKLADDTRVLESRDLDDRAQWALQQVEDRSRQGDLTLLVLDNVESWPPDPLPDVSAVRMLVTTRVRELHNSLRSYEVPPLELGPSQRLLDAIVRYPVPRADELLHALGGHVLSIELAGTYLRHYGASATGYLRHLAAGKNPGSSIADRTAYRASAPSAFRLLWKRIGPALQHAWVLAAQLPPTWFSSELADAIGLDVELRGGLVQLHILDRDDQQGRQRMHQLLRGFALTEEARRGWWQRRRGAALRTSVIQGATELLEAGDEALCFRRYLRDADSFAHLAARTERTPSGGRLVKARARALRQPGKLGDLAAACVRALRRSGKHGTLAVARARLQTACARALRQGGELGDLAAARKLYEQALEVYLEAYGERGPAVATCRNDLGTVLQSLGELASARKLYDQALEAYRRIYREDHTRVVICRNNLATVLKAIGDLPALRVLYDRALKAYRRIYGDDHPSVATIRDNLACVLKDLRATLEQALASYLKASGEDHPSVATTRHNLASVLKDLSALPTARPVLEQAQGTGQLSGLDTYER